MEKQVVLGGITLSLLVILGLLWLAVSTGLVGDVTGWHGGKQDDRRDDGNHALGGGDDHGNQTNHTIETNESDDDHDDAFALRATPPNTALADQTVTLTANADGRGVNITFSATIGSCTQVIGTDASAPYTVTWQPSLGPCGVGNFTLSVVEHRKSKRNQTTQIPYVVLSHPVMKLVDSQNATGDTFVTTSSLGYPPAAGSSSSQVLADLPLGPTTTDGEHYDVSGSITGRKVSGGSFNLEYRLVNAANGTLLTTGTLTDPTTSTTQTFATSVAAPTAGFTGDLQLQFRSTQDFSAVGVDNFSIVVNHYGLR